MIYFETIPSTKSSIVIDSFEGNNLEAENKRNNK